MPPLKIGAPNLMEHARRVRSWLWKFEDNTTLAPGVFTEDPILDEDIRGAIYIDEGGLGQEDLLLFVRKNDTESLEIAEFNFGTAGPGGGITAVVEDLTPELGGNLDVGLFSVGAADAADLTKLSELTASSTELNYVDGVTSDLQTQLNARAIDAAVVHDTGDETIAGEKTFSGPTIYLDAIDAQAGIVTVEVDATAGSVFVADDAYGAGWDGSLAVPTRNAVYDKIETVVAGGGGLTLEQVYDALGGGVLVAGNNLDIVADDALDTITFSVETLTAADISDVTSSAAELNILDGATLTVTELNFVDGVTSAIQGQIDGKQPLDSDLTTIAGLTATTNNFMVANASAWASRTPTQAIAHLGLDADIATFALPASTTISAFGATLVDDADAATVRTTIGAAPTASPTFTGTVTLPTGLTGVVRADSGVVSVDTDVTDLVTAASTTAQGKVELATDAETNTGTDTARAITPSNLEAWTGSAQVTTVGTLASPVLTTPTIASFTNATHGHTDAASGGALTLTQSVVIPFGDGTNVLTVNEKRRFSIPVAHTLIRWRILSSVSGSVVFDVWRDTYANYPPVVGDSISTSKPTLSSATNAEDSTITDWTEVGAAGDVYIVNVDSVTSCVDVVLELWFTRAIA
jgi:hypothetical protein